MGIKNDGVPKNTQVNFNRTKRKINEILKNLGKPYIDSFNYMLSEGLDDCVRNLEPLIFDLPDDTTVSLQIESISIAPPTVPPHIIECTNRKMYPKECRQRKSTYKGMCTVRVGWTMNGARKPSIDRDLGELPIMVGSAGCNLNKMTPDQMIAHGEHENEWGGYFVLKGNERIIRMLVMTRRNYPVGMKRPSWKDRGQFFSDTGVLIRCVKSDQTSTNNVLHFLNNGTAKFMLSHQKTLVYLPLVLLLKTLVNYTDERIYQELIRGHEDDHYYIGCVQNMLRDVHEEGIHTHAEAKEYLGNIFKPRCYNLPTTATNTEVTDYILSEQVLIHLNDPIEKFNLIVFMVQKLFDLVQGRTKYENVDSVMMMELLLGGHLYQQILKEKLGLWLQSVKMNILKKATTAAFNLTQADMVNAMRYTFSVEKIMANFLATGNLNSRSGLGLMQNTGLVVLADNINRMRYMANFRAIHRGSFFVEMRTTEARQLLPDAWGFVCPVHTPDGSPCGLLNHLTVDCVVSETIAAEKVNEISKLLVELGMVPINGELLDNRKNYISVQLEGRMIGFVRNDDALETVAAMRGFKINGERIPNMTEIVHVPPKKGGQYPGIFIFVGPARMMRPVINLKHNRVEYIGTFEQVYMDICITPKELYKGYTTHMELSKTSFLSNLANLIPMPDCNQSPRNMYQCQMGKQTMGTPCHNWPLKGDSKLYRLQTPSAPIFRPVHHDLIDMDDFAMGTNAIVAVVSYTGYDMEDAMIINKASYERGFAHGSIVSTTFVDLDGDNYFARDPHNHDLVQCLDTDGLPHPGSRLSYGIVYYCYFDTSHSVYVTEKFKGKEDVIVDSVKICGSFSTVATKTACITYRTTRNPSVGDKFASRAGQKGICSQKWPAEDLPFTDSGLIPDVLFNPHGFPSRMTIAMMIEMMAGKSGALHGLIHDATPFKFTEKDTAIDYFGKLLEQSGYSYYGTERMYNGIDGREMRADIFFGVVHYQRLRHMVSDKWQVRSTGPIDVLTHQPVKGRKRGGGVRFGEMERDALISHGTSFLLQDRLFHCSDKISTMICRQCGTLLGPLESIHKRALDSTIVNTPMTCRLCTDGSHIGQVEIPYIFKFLVTQLSSVNINVKMDFKSI